MSILEYLGEFQWFWVVLEERKQKGRALLHLDLLSLIGLYHNVEGRMEKLGFMKLVDDLKSLNLI